MDSRLLILLSTEGEVTAVSGVISIVLAQDFVGVNWDVSSIGTLPEHPMKQRMLKDFLHWYFYNAQLELKEFSMSDYILNWDKALTSIAAWTKLHRDMVKLALGSSILLYGHYFPGTILLVSSLRISGVGAFRKQFQFLSATFSRTLEAIRLSTPELLKLTEQAAALRNELEELNRMQRNGNISLAQYQEGSARLQRDIVAMDQIQRKLSSTVTLLSTAIDPQGLQEVFGQMYSSLATCVAAASSKYMQFCSIGFSIGHVISDRLAVVIHARKERIEAALKQASAVSVGAITSTLEAAVNATSSSTTSSKSKSEVSANTDADASTSNVSAISILGEQTQVTLLRLIDERDWVTPTANFLGNAVGWMIAYYLQNLASAMSACSLGSEMVVSSVQNLVDPHLEKMGLPTSRAKEFSEGVALVQTALIGAGFARVLWSRGLLGSSSSSLPGGLAGLLLWPLSKVESLINAVFTTMDVGLK